MLWVSAAAKLQAPFASLINGSEHSVKFIAAARAQAKANRIDLTDKRKLGYGSWHLEKTNLFQPLCLYTLISLPLPLLAPLSRLTVTWLFHFTVSVAMVVKGEKLGSHPIPSDCNSLYVCQRVPRRSIRFRCAAAAWIRGRTTKTRQSVSFNLTWRNHASKHPIFRGNEQLEKINSTHYRTWELGLGHIYFGVLWLEDVLAKMISAPTRSENSDRHVS